MTYLVCFISKRFVSRNVQVIEIICFFSFLDFPPKGGRKRAAFARPATRSTPFPLVCRKRKNFGEFFAWSARFHYLNKEQHGEEQWKFTTMASAEKRV